MTEESGCNRCGACCRVIPLSTSAMSPDYRKYLLNRGLKEEQGFILIPNDCQHLHSESRVIGYNEVLRTTIDEETFSCDIHDSPDRPFICRKFTGQKQIGRWRMYIPPACAFNNKS